MIKKLGKGTSILLWKTTAFSPTVVAPSPVILENGNIYMMEELEGTGDDGEFVFQLGRTHALIPLANKVLNQFLEELIENNREDIFYGQNQLN